MTESPETGAPPAPACHVRCNRCRGTGKVELTGVLIPTLELLRSQPGEVSGSDFAKVAGIHPATMNHRLQELEARDLVTSRASGGKRLWRAL